jgi:hypothetical protein
LPLSFSSLYVSFSFSKSKLPVYKNNKETNLESKNENVNKDDKVNTSSSTSIEKDLLSLLNLSGLHYLQVFQ